MGPTPEIRPSEIAGRISRPTVRSPYRRTGPGWFAELGSSLAAGDLYERPSLEQPPRAFIRLKATGVFLLRGSAIVTS